MRQVVFVAALVTSAVVLTPEPGPAATVFSTDFETGSALPNVSSTSSGAAGSATADIAPVGTIDVQGSSAPSAAVRLVVKPPRGGRDWAAAAVVGPVSFPSGERDPRKVTLSFMASVSTLQPVTVRVEASSASGEITASASAEVYPAAADFYQRFAIELSAFKTANGQPFEWGSAGLRQSFGVRQEPGLPARDAYELRVDNVALATPSFYVSPTGDDAADGKTERSAFASPQKALGAAAPGDVILLRGGTYWADGNAFNFVRPGTPAAWIVLKNAPGETPVLRSKGWATLNIGEGSKEAMSTKPAMAYLEIRGLRTLGSNTTDREGRAVSAFPKLLGKTVPETNGNGILIDGRFSKGPVHHIRVADCQIEGHPGGGLTSIYSDWISFENNVTRDNAWFSNFACSGISILQGSAFDSTSGSYRFLVSGNRSSGNRCYQAWTASEMNNAPQKLSDGNGIIIDTLDTSKPNEAAQRLPFTGRTLVVDNLSFNNGGSGIHLVSSPNVDLVNNTTYLNSASPELHYGQMYAYRSAGCNFVNNILVPAENEKYNKASDYAEAGNSNTTWSNNLFFGSNVEIKAGLNDVKADPKFVRPSRLAKSADFSLRPGSPAIDAGTRAVAVPIPLTDIDGRRRPMDRNPAIGAYQP